MSIPGDRVAQDRRGEQLDLRTHEPWEQHWPASAELSRAFDRRPRVRRLVAPIDDMASVQLEEQGKSGFDFSNHTRNAALAAKGHVVPRATSTGTTIVGLIYKDGVVLGADTRATEGPIVADKNCEKIHYISDHIRCCGAGTAADTEFVTNLISSNIQLHELNTRKRARVVTAMTLLKQRLFQYQGHIGAALVLGGYDTTGPQLFTIAPHGSTDKLPYVTMGSGSLAAMSVFESRWRPNMEVCVMTHHAGNRCH